MKGFQRMPNETYDDWEDDSYEYDDFEAEDSDADETETVACPHCKEEIYEDAEQCPYCGQYVTPGSVTSNRKPLWVVITAVVTIYAILHFYISAIFFG